MSCKELMPGREHTFDVDMIYKYTRIMYYDDF